MTAAVELTGVSKTFRGRAGDVTALSDVDLSVSDGEFVTFIGPSGCGKSTLLRIVADLTAPTTGTVTVNGTRRTIQFGPTTTAAPFRTVRLPAVLKRGGNTVQIRPAARAVGLDYLDATPFRTRVEAESGGVF